jgi:hypothetical protein
MTKYAFLLAVVVLWFPASAADKHKVSSEVPMQESTVGDVRYKRARWDKVVVGNCVLSDGTLTIGSDGSVKFDATTWTNHTNVGATWHAGILLKDKDGKIQEYGGHYDSRRMNDGPPPPHFHMGGASKFEPTRFDLITTATLNSEC